MSNDDVVDIAVGCIHAALDLDPLVADTSMIAALEVALSVDYINDNPERLGALLHALAVQAASACSSASANISVSPPSGSRDLVHAIAQGAADLLTNGITHDPGDEPHSSR